MGGNGKGEEKGEIGGKGETMEYKMGMERIRSVCEDKGGKIGKEKEEEKRMKRDMQGQMSDLLLEISA